MRSLRNHLYELARICELLDNANMYVDGDGTRLIRTRDLGQWLKLAAELSHVEIDSWKFAGADGPWCRPAAVMYTSDSDHFSEYSTLLVRFIYIYNALEELFKFLSKNYSSVSKKIKSSSVKCVELLNENNDIVLPKHFWHLSKNYLYFFKSYIDRFVKTVKCDVIFNNKVSFTLDILRNVRNQIAHGTFPIAENPEYEVFHNNEMHLLTNLLAHSCRLAAIYIQVILFNYNEGFSQGYELFVDTLTPDSVEPFLREHLLNLHLRTDFGFNPTEFSSWESMQNGHSM